MLYGDDIVPDHLEESPRIIHIDEAIQLLEHPRGDNEVVLACEGIKEDFCCRCAEVFPVEIVPVLYCVDDDVGVDIELHPCHRKWVWCSYCC